MATIRITVDVKKIENCKKGVDLGYSGAKKNSYTTD